MVLAYLLFFLPAFVWSSKDSVAIVPAEDLKVCEYFDARIIRLGEVVSEELRPDVDVDSELYNTLEESKLCDTVGYVAIPECVANNEGDECVARKTSEMITRTFRNAMEAKKIKEVPSGEKFFATCKHIGYKNVLKTFKSARSLMSAECGLPGLGGNRERRNADLLPALLLAGSYDPSSIWFQYFLCKDIDLYCYFFTQGWTQGQYGQYYLYDNLLDDNTGLFAGSTDSSNLATIALLGGLGGGIGQPSGYYPSYGAHAASAQGRKRREVDVCVGDVCDDFIDGNRRRRELCADGTMSEDCSDRKRRDSCEDSDDPKCKRKKRSNCPDGSENCTDRKRQDVTNHDEEEVDERKRRSTDCRKFPNHKDCPNRKRRTVDCNADPDHKDCSERKRRSVDSVYCKTNQNHPDCKSRKRRSNDKCTEKESDASCRKRRQACEDCENNPDSTKCAECL